MIWAFDLYLTSSFPITFPWTFDVAPLRISTVDFYPGDVLGDVLYEARILEKPLVSRLSSDPFGGIEEIDAVKFRVSARTVARWQVLLDTSAGFDPAGYDPAGYQTTPDTLNITGIFQQDLGPYPDLHAWVTSEHRGKLIIGHLVELDAKFRAVTVQQNLFRGEITAMADEPGTVSILARAIDLSSFTETVPVTRVATSWATYAPSGSLGQVVPFGAGIGRRIPCVPVKAQTEDTTLFEETFTANAGTDALTIVGHFLDTGFGPYRLLTTGTLPGGLLSTIDYFVIVTTEDEFQLALSQGDALNGVAVDITSVGTGVHTMLGGLAPNLSDDYDLVVGTGNIGIIRVWEGDSSQGANVGDVPDIPVSYEVQHKTYRPNGRYFTSLRFQDQLDGIAVTADVIRVYPDVDDAVVAEWKWLPARTSA